MLASGKLVHQVLIAGCAAVVVYLNAVDGPFIYDDDYAILQNPDVQEQTKIWELWSNDYWGLHMLNFRSHKSYRPLTVLSFRFSHRMWGNSSRCFRAENVLLHALVSCLFVVFCRQIVFRERDENAPMICGVLFALHPIHTEAVDGAVGRAEMLSAIFFFLAALVYAETSQTQYKNKARMPQHRLDQVDSTAARAREEKDAGLQSSSQSDNHNNSNKIIEGTLRKRNPHSGSNDGADVSKSGSNDNKTAHCIPAADSTENCVGLNQKSESEDLLWHVVWMAPALVLTVCALLCKESGLSVLGVLFAIDIISCTEQTYSSRNTFYFFKSPRLLTKMIMITGFGVIMVIFRLWIMNFTKPTYHPMDNVASTSKSRLTRFMTYAALPWMNMWLLIFPLNLCYDWGYSSIPLLASVLDKRNLISLLFYFILGALIFISWQSIRDRRSHGRPLVMGMSMMIFPFIPSSNVFFPVGFVIAERCLYMPSAGFIILSVLLWNKASEKWPNLQRLLYILLSTTAVLYFTRTMMRNRDWSSKENFFRAGFMTNPANEKCRYNWANRLREKQMLQEAAEHYRIVLATQPNHSQALNNLAHIYAVHNNTKDKAEELLIRAIAIAPGEGISYLALADLYVTRGKLDLAERIFTKCVKMAMYDEGHMVQCARKIAATPGAEDHALRCYGVLLRRVCNDNPNAPSLKLDACTPAHLHHLIDFHQLLKKRGKKEQAESVEKRIKQLGGDTASNMHVLVKLAQKSAGGGEPKKALEIVQKFLSSTHQPVLNLNGVWEVASTLYKFRHFRECDQIFQAMRRIDPDNLEMLAQHASVCFEMGEQMRGEKLLHELRERDVTCLNVQARIVLANIYDQRGEEHTSEDIIGSCLEDLDKQLSVSDVEIRMSVSERKTQMLMHQAQRHKVQSEKLRDLTMMQEAKKHWIVAHKTLQEAASITSARQQDAKESLRQMLGDPYHDESTKD